MPPKSLFAELALASEAIKVNCQKSNNLKTTILMKVSSFLLSICLLFACSSKDVDKPLKASVNASVDKQSEHISGLVTSIENGKDGFTAQVQSTAGTSYAVLVSIPNLGGPENYTRFEVGDRAVSYTHLTLPTIYSV